MIVHVSENKKYRYTNPCKYINITYAINQRGLISIYMVISWNEA